LVRVASNTARGGVLSGKLGWLTTARELSVTLSLGLLEEGLLLGLAVALHIHRLLLA
jgi:hypothetical protein